MKTQLTLIAATLFALTACQPENTSQSQAPTSAPAPSAEQSADATLLQQAQSMFKPLPTLEESKQAYTYTDAQVKLGQQLYHEPRLSLGNDISCNTCHGVNSYGVDARNTPTSEGHNKQFGARNSPTSLNAFLLKTQFWDGRAPTVEEQAKGPLVNPVEMAMPDLDAVVKKVNAIQAYKDAFKTVYADKGGEVNIDNIAHAIGAFERTLLTPSRWDNYLKGDVNALNAQEKRGLKAFMDNGCITCHTGVNLTNDSFQKFGLVKGPYWDYIPSKEVHDEGVFEVTQKEEDKYFFRVPPLRNIAKTAPYFHNGSVNDLGEAVRVMAETQVGKTLSKEDIDAIVAFLGSTTGEVPAEALVVPELPK